jgi:rhodanese-related sulfurtransferase
MQKSRGKNMDNALDTAVELEHAEAVGDVPEAARRPRAIRSIDPVDAWRLLQSNSQAILVDVRSSVEFLFVGHPVGAIHVPWMDEPDWTPNPEFTRQVTAGVAGTRNGADAARIPVLLICRSGKRSLEAGEVLAQAGFEELYNVSTGFEGDLDHEHHRGTVNGWRCDGLPWEQC